MRRRSAQGRTWTKRNGDFIGIAMVAGLFTALGYLVYWSTVAPASDTAQQFNFGFGRNVSCESVGSLEPVCTQRRR